MRKFEQLPEALQAFQTAVKQYHADEIVPDDVIRCAATLYFRLGQMQEYEKYKQQILSHIDDMHAAEFMDACTELFACGMDSDDGELIMTILHAMDRYMEKYPDESKVGLTFSELKYTCAVKKEISSQISELERDALTGFKNRKAYYKDIEIFERDKEIGRWPVGAVFVDVNGLKEANDRLGHDAGDTLITLVAEVITEIFLEARRYRFGGDEFVILSFDKEEAVFNDRVKRLSGSWKDQYSASVGSVWRERAENFEQIVAAADKKMYMDKSRYYEERCMTGDNPGRY